MRVVILAGGFGTRISEESYLKPKPMIEIGEYPILVHIMKIYASQGHKDFIICAGYKQQCIKQYFANFGLYTNDVTFDLSSQKVIYHKTNDCDWTITICDTGLFTQTGGRVKRVSDHIGNQRFMLTYGDAVGNINLDEVLKSHIKSGKLATICVYNYGQTKGVVDIEKNGLVRAFREKSNLDSSLINIGFMICEPQILDYINSDGSILEKDVLQKLAEEKQLNAYVHTGFWQCMDTMREKEKLESLWESGEAPWRIWND